MSAMLLFGICLLVVIGPHVNLYDPMAADFDSVLAAPNGTHLLGTDKLGRDVLSRVIAGGGNTIFVALLGTLIAVIPGGLLGLVSGGSCPRCKQISLVLLNALLAIPGLLIGLVVLSIMGQGIWQLALATGFSALANYAQYTRSVTHSLLDRDFVLAARALGAKPTRIVFKHIMLNGLPALIGYVGVIFGYSVVTGATLSFLGLGGDPSIPEWGAMLANGRSVLRQAPWVSISPMLLIVTLVLTVNTLADTLLNR